MTDTKAPRIRRFAAALLCALLTFAPMTGASAATIEYTVTASKVNVREKANTSSGVVAVLRQGETLTLISSDENGWLKVKSAHGEGYLSAEYACLTAITGLGAEAEVLAEKLNVRAKPSADSSVLAVPRRGSTLSVLGLTDGWLKVSYDGKTGYVSPEYVALTPGTETAVPQPTVTAAPENTGLLKKGSRGDAVVSLQQKLISLGYLTGTADGIYGNSTVSAVKAFQRASGLTADGDAGASTLAALAAAMATPVPTPAATPAPAQSSVLKEGSRGDAVVSLQQKLISLGYLTGKADGIYGNSTVSAVKAFQRASGLTADGDAGASTLAALSAAMATPVPTPAATPAPTQSSVLKEGSRGDAVVSLQQKLISLGYLTGKADGIYGNSTVSAVKAFQRASGLTADGDAGASTLAALAAAMATPTPVPTATPAPAQSSVLQKGDRGDAVKAVQEQLIVLGYLSGKADGIFGSDTRDAVKTFQRNQGMDDDGKVGAATLAALNAASLVAPSNPVQPESDPLNTSKLLKQGSTGAEVQALQERLITLGYLNGAADGYYSVETANAVRAFQRDQGLTADGIAGTSTLAALSTASGSTSPNNPTGASLLKYGDTGEAVKALQTRLKELGYFNGSIGGNFGTITRDAVKAFQSAAGLTNDGMAGEATLTALYAADAPKMKDSTLRAGDTGDAVTEMQTRLIALGYLSGSADGKFGSSTQSAVMAFQTAAGLSADGIAGLSTLNALYSSDAPIASAPVNPGTGETGSANSAVAEKIIETAKKYLGCKYVYACEDPPYFDCSGLTQYVFKQYGYSLLRTAYQQGYNDKYQKLTISQLRMGDLVFFNTNLTDGDMCDHTGIYIGDGDFIHASSSAGKVIISNLNSGYYNQRFSWGRRILE